MLVFIVAMTMMIVVLMIILVWQTSGVEDDENDVGASGNKNVVDDDCNDDHGCGSDETDDDYVGDSGVGGDCACFSGDEEYGRVDVGLMSLVQG